MFKVGDKVIYYSVEIYPHLPPIPGTITEIDEEDIIHIKPNNNDVVKWLFIVASENELTLN